jgi:hypothetical protein
LSGPHLDPPEGGLEGAVVELAIEPGRTLGEMRVDTALAEFVGQSPLTPASIHRPKLDKTAREALIVKKIELTKPLERALDVVIVKSLAAELLDKLGAEVVAAGDELESFVVGRIFQVLNS